MLTSKVFLDQDRTISSNFKSVEQVLDHQAIQPAATKDETEPIK